jgi:hypothetical protein
MPENIAYEVGVQIVLGGNIGKVIQGVAEEFRKLDQIVGQSQSSVDSLAAAIGKLNAQGAAATGWASRFAQDMERAAAAAGAASRGFSGYGGVGGTTGGGGGAAGIGTKGDRSGPPLLLSGPEERGGSAPYEPPGYEQRPPYNAPELNLRPRPEEPGREGGGALDAIGGVMIADQVARVLAHPFVAAASADKIIATLKSQKFTPEELARAQKEALSTQQSVMPTTYAGNLQLISALAGVLANPEEALKLMPSYAKFAATLSPSGEAAFQNVLGAIKVPELLGMMVDPKSGKIDASRIAPLLNAMVQLQYFTGQQVSPADVHAFVKSGGVAAMMLAGAGGPNGGRVISDTAALIQAMGPERAGTALQAFSAQWSTGRFNKALIRILSEAHVISDPSKVIPAGMGYYMLDRGAMPQSTINLARENPVGFVLDYLVPHLETYLSQKYGKGFTGASAQHQSEMIMAELQRDASRIPGGRFMAEVYKNRPLIERDRAYLASMPSSDQIYQTNTNTNPQLHWSGFTAAVNAFETIVGQNQMGTAIGNLDALTKTIDQLTNFSAQHGTETSLALHTLTGSLIGLGSGALLAGLIKFAAFLGPEGTLVAAVGAATGALTAGVLELDKVLHQQFPWAYKGVDKFYDDLKKHPIVVPKEWTSPTAFMDEMHKLIFGDAHAAPVSSSQSHAPTISAMNGSPVPITGHVTATVTNGKDLASGVTGAQASALNRPNNGVTGHNVQLDPFGPVAQPAPY